MVEVGLEKLLLVSVLKKHIGSMVIMETCND